MLLKASKSILNILSSTFVKNNRFPKLTAKSPRTDVLRNILRPYRRSFEGGLKKIPPYGEFWGALFGWLTRRSRRSFGRDSTMVRGWRGTLLLSQYSGIDMCVLEKNAKSLLRLRTVCCFF